MEKAIWKRGPQGLQIADRNVQKSWLFYSLLPEIPGTNA
jgi:hypothetical protein